MTRRLLYVWSLFGLAGPLAVVLLALTAPAVRAEKTWPQFRGPDGQGRTSEMTLPLTWSETEHVKWKTPLPGRGWSSPVIADGHIWVTTAEERAPTDEERAEIMKPVANMGIAKAMEAVGSVALSAIEINLETGEVIRTVPLFTVDRPAPIHGLNSFASPTPVIVEGKVICHFGAMGTAAVDAKTGQKLWERKFEINHIVGPGSSPVAYKNLAIITCDGGDKQYIAAVDAATGHDVWTMDRPPLRASDPDLRKAYCTPLLINVAGRDELVVPGAQWFIAYEPLTGHEIWRVDHGAGYSNVPRPVFDGELVYCDTGFNKAQLWAIRPDGEGDVTETHVVWRCKEQMPTMPSPVISDGRIYVISEGGVASCLDAATGDPVYPKKRVGGQFSASPLLGAGRVYYCSQDGHTTVIAASDKYEVLAENNLDGKIMASPAAIDGDLILRTDTHLYRISEKK